MDICYIMDIIAYLNKIQNVLYVLLYNVNIIHVKWP